MADIKEERPHVAIDERGMKIYEGHALFGLVAEQAARLESILLRPETWPNFTGSVTRCASVEPDSDRQGKHIYITTYPGSAYTYEALLKRIPTLLAEPAK